jgi:hypothetical protein
MAQCWFCTSILAAISSALAVLLIGLTNWLHNWASFTFNAHVIGVLDVSSLAEATSHTHLDAWWWVVHVLARERTFRSTLIEGLVSLTHGLWWRWWINRVDNWSDWEASLTLLLGNRSCGERNQ